MSNRKYPYIYGRTPVKPSQKHHVCKVCQQPATHRCEIQTSWFRGDDVYEFRCAYHSKEKHQ